MAEKTLLLNSGKCSWGKCFACGWGRLASPRLGIHELKKIVDDFFHENRNEKIGRLKIFASGSFLDDAQFPKAIRKYVAVKCAALGIELVVESRPEFITAGNLEDFKGAKLTVAIGLESGDDAVLKKYSKGFAAADYIKAANLLHENSFRLRTYLMVGLPFGSADSLKKSVELADKCGDEIVLINVFPHSLAPLYELWIRTQTKFAAEPKSSAFRASGDWKPLDKEQFEEAIAPYKSNPKIETDFNNFSFVPRFSREKQEMIKGASEKELLHPHFEVWQDYICRFYETPKEKKTVLFLPCTFTKPYYNSKLHREIAKIAGNKKDIHLVVLSSPGVIPYEFANKYPFNSYDWPEWEETPEIKKKYIEVTEKRIENYLRSHKYEKYFCFLKPSETFVALEKACNKLKIPLASCLKPETWEKIKGEKNPLLLALDDLEESLNKENRK
ncbi:MAG: DUF5591 domain-containing protein [Candidatus Aenigmatarchaeota archaeon]